MSACICCVDVSSHLSCKILTSTEMLPPLLSREGEREEEPLLFWRIRRDGWKQGEGLCAVEKDFLTGPSAKMVQIMWSRRAHTPWVSTVGTSTFLKQSKEKKNKWKCTWRSPDVEWENKGAKVKPWSPKQREPDVMNMPCSSRSLWCTGNVCCSGSQRTSFWKVFKDLCNFTRLVWKAGVLRHAGNTRFS